MPNAEDRPIEEKYIIKAPTLVLGVGGTGSLIVNRLAGRVKGRPGFDKVHFHIFDTDINDMDKMKNLSKENKTLTSASVAIGQVIDRGLADPDVKEWFIYNDPLIRDKDLTKGAAQIRMISRLAMDFSLREGMFAGFENSLTNIFAADGAGVAPSPRVFIVGTLAGGTGAGIFLELAFYLKNLFSNRYRLPNPQIFGDFILPTVLILNDKINQTEQSNLYANAYASIKELTAFMSREANDTVELAWCRDQLQNNPLAPSRIPRMDPYTHVTLYDYFNSMNAQLGSWNDYLDIIEDALYVNVLTRVAANNESRLDNALRLRVEDNQGKSFILGAGTSRLEYPKKDLYKLFSNMWVEELLSAKWLKIDKIIQKQIKDAESEHRQGANVKIPTKADLFPNTLQALATGDKPDNFFKDIYESTKIVIDSERGTKRDKHLHLKDAIDDLIQKSVQENLIETYLYEELNWDNESASDKLGAIQYITNYERNLRSFRDKADNLAITYRSLLSGKILLDDAEERNFRSGANYAINTYIFDPSEENCMHPLAVRSFLYQLNTTLKAEVRDLKIETDQLRRSLTSYFARAFDDPKTPDVEETLEMRLSDLRDDTGFGAAVNSIFGGGWKAFRDDYKEKAEHRQKPTIINYCQKALKLNVYQSLIENLNLVISNWESFFNHLKNIISDCEDQIERYKLIHQEDQQVSGYEKTVVGNKRYILGSQSEKEYLWDHNFRSRVTANEIDAGFSQSLYLNRYKDDTQQIQRRKEGFESNFSWDRQIRQLKRNLIKYAKEQLLESRVLEMDLWNAIEYQYNHSEKLLKKYDSKTKYISHLLSEIDHLAPPMLQTEIGGGARDRAYNSWGMNPRIYSSSPRAVQDNFEENTSTVVEDAGFPNTILVRYRAHYGIKPTDIPSFSLGGSHYKAYHSKLQKRRDPSKNFISNHLDKRWDEPAFLPDLNKDVIDKQQEIIRKALFYGMSQESITIKRKTDSDRSLVWTFTDPFDQSRIEITKFNKKVDATIKGLYDALQFNTVLCKSIVDYADERLQDDLDKNRRIGSVSFINELYNIELPDHNTIHKECNLADIFLTLVKDGFSNGNSSQLASILATELQDMLSTHFRKVRSASNRDGGPSQEAFNRFKELVESARYYEEVQNNNPTMLQRVFER